MSEPDDRERYIVPALERGLVKAGKSRDEIEIMSATLVVTADTEEEFLASKEAARKRVREHELVSMGGPARARSSAASHKVKRFAPRPRHRKRRVSISNS